MVGNPYPMETEQNSLDSIHDENLRDAPFGFDSVIAHTAGTDCYMIYSDANIKTYPMFMVYYK